MLIRGGGYSKPRAGSQLDYSHRLTRGLVLALPLNEGDGEVQNLAKYSAIRPSFSSTPPSHRGGGLFFAGTASYLTFGNPAGFTSDLTTAFVVVRYDTQRGEMMGYASSGSGRAYYHGINRTTPAQHCGWGGGAPIVGSVLTTIGKPHALVASRTGASSSWTIDLYFDGAIDKAAQAYAVSPNSPTELVIGRMGAENGNYFKGEIRCACAWNRKLSADEVAEWSAEPWGMLRTMPWRRYYDMSGAAAGGDAVPQAWMQYRARRAA